MLLVQKLAIQLELKIRIGHTPTLFYLIILAPLKSICFSIYICIFYFQVNGSIGIVQKIDFEIRPDLGCATIKTSRKVVLDNPSVCLSVYVSVCV